MKIFCVGGSGMVGSRMIDLLRKKYTVDDLSLTNGVDITNINSLDVIKNDRQHSLVLHLAAKADVDACERDKKLGENGDAYRINVLGTQNVANVCLASNKKLFYISTDFVFDGKNDPPFAYKEDDIPNPLNWYAETKFKAEEMVRNSGVKHAILRIAYPYRKDTFEQKNDFVHAIMGRLSSNKPVMAITDHIMTPTYIDDVSSAIAILADNNASGIYHVVGSQSLTPYDAFLMIAKRFGYDSNLISKTTREEYFKGKAQRPFNLSLSNGKIVKLGIEMKSFEEGLQQVS